jgi:hypothetical protein
MKYTKTFIKQPNILGQYQVNVSPDQADYLLRLLKQADVSQLTIGEYLEHQKLEGQCEDILDSFNNRELEV